MMGMFKRIGAIIDDVFSDGDTSDTQAKPEEIVSRGIEMAVTLFETEFDQFRKVAYKQWKHPLGVAVDQFGGTWTITVNGRTLDTGYQGKIGARLDAVLKRERDEVNAACVQTLAEAIVARGKAAA